MIGAPLAAGLLALNGKGGLKGWQVRRGAHVCGGHPADTRRGVPATRARATRTPTTLRTCVLNHLAQWLFLMEGIPAILLGVGIFALLPDSIATAGFLTVREREALAAAVARDHAPGPLANDLRGAAQLLRNTLRNSYMWFMFMAAIVPSLASHTYQLCAARGLGASRRHIA